MISVVVLSAAVVVASLGVLWGADLLDRGRLKEIGAELKSWYDRSPWWVVLAVLIGLVALSVGTESPSLLMGGLALAVLVLFARAWVREFLFLMSLQDADLPGRFDKLVWAALLIGLPPVGLWVFRAYHLERWPEPARTEFKPAGVADLA